jgi:ribosomal protein L16 Arg81 hydroxylase
MCRCSGGSPEHCCGRPLFHLENHFDGSRNSIALLGGERRYILAHPNQCENLSLYPKGHPSARHSAVDWSDPDVEEFPQFRNAMANEVVMQAGDVMYLPTNWFHYIVSLEINYQCNTRSGISNEYMQDIHDCGF